MFDINKIFEEIQLQEEKNYYIAQELYRLLMIEEKDPINRDKIVKIFTQIVS